MIRAFVENRSNWTWSLEQDLNWRETVQSSYFANKVPDSGNILPAAALIGAATAFGLATLFPLNVPAGQPLMYCNPRNVVQNSIKIDKRAYACLDGKLAVTCPRFLQKDESGSDSRSCYETTLDCSTSRRFISNGDVIYCSDGISVNETKLYIGCHRGGLVHRKQAAFIPRPKHKMTEWQKKMLIVDELEPFHAQKWIPEALTIPQNILEGITKLENTTIGDFNSTKNLDNESITFKVSSFSNDT